MAKNINVDLPMDDFLKVLDEMRQDLGDDFVLDSDDGFEKLDEYVQRYKEREDG